MSDEKQQGTEPANDPLDIDPLDATTEGDVSDGREQKRAPVDDASR